MSVLEYLRFAADLRHLDDETFRKRAKSVVEVCGLAQVLGKEIQHLSHGYRQRVGLAQALIHDPPILILDEPTSDLDPNEKAEFLDYLKQIGQERTVMLSTHNLAEVEASCARAIIVSRGRIVADGPLDEIRAKSGRVRYVVSIQESTGDAAVPRARRRSRRRARSRTSLGKVDGVKKLSELPTDERAHAYELVSEQDVDLRPELFKRDRRQGLGAPRAAPRRADARGRVPQPHHRRRAPQPPARCRRRDEDEDEEESDEDETDEDDGRRLGRRRRHEGRQGRRS